MAPTFSNLAALAEEVERAELDILRRALERLEEIKDQPGMQAECHTLIRVVERSIGASFARDNMGNGPYCNGAHGGASMPGGRPMQPWTMPR